MCGVWRRVGGAPLAPLGLSQDVLTLARRILDAAALNEIARLADEKAQETKVCVRRFVNPCSGLAIH